MKLGKTLTFYGNTPFRDLCKAEHRPKRNGLGKTHHQGQSVGEGSMGMAISYLMTEPFKGPGSERAHGPYVLAL